MRKYKNTKMLLKNYEFSIIFKKGKYYSNKNIYCFYVKNHTLENKVGFISSKKNGNAVKRNRVKRLLRQAFLNNIDGIYSGMDLVLGIKKNVDIDKLSIHDIEEELNSFIKEVESSENKR